MKKIISIIVMTFIFITLNGELSAGKLENAQPMQIEKIKKMDRKMTHRQAVKKNFKNQNEFKTLKEKRNLRNRKTHVRNNTANIYRERHRNRHKEYYNNYRYETIPYYTNIRQKGYRNFKRGWYLAYKYDRAVFNDRYGYHYGYFNRHGYYFEGMFYRYDREYRYNDRVRGKGIFDNRYYIPSNYNYYGFIKPMHSRPYRY